MMRIWSRYDLPTLALVNSDKTAAGQNIENCFMSNGIYWKSLSAFKLLITIIFLATFVDGTSLDIAIAFAKYTGALYNPEEVERIMPLLNHNMRDILDSLLVAPLIVKAVKKFSNQISGILMKMTFKLVIFGYLIPFAVMIFVTIVTCWYIREEIRNLYQMLVPFPVAKQACERYLARMDKKLIKKMMQEQEERAKKINTSITTISSNTNTA